MHPNRISSPSNRLIPFIGVILFVVIHIIFPKLAYAQTIHTFTDGYGGDVFTADDTTIKYWGTGFQNGGMHNSFAPGVNESSLLRFNLSSIPPTATCISAKLYLYHDSNPESAPNPTTGNVYSLTAANRDWVSGTKDITNASDGETTWNVKAYNRQGWAGQTAGGKVPGVDYEAQAIGSYSANPGDPIGTVTIINLDTNRVKGWFGSPNSNYGIVIIGTRSEIHWGQANQYFAAYRPKLEITYSTGAIAQTPIPSMTPTPPPKLGDANRDNRVDGLDYITWLSHFGQNVSGPTNGDFNNSDRVDGLDYIVWLNNFGK